MLESGEETADSEGSGGRIELFIHLGTLWLQSLSLRISSVSLGGTFEMIPWSALLKICLFILTVTLAIWRKQERKHRRALGLGKRVKTDGNPWLQEEGCGQRRGMCHMRTEQGVL